LRMSLRGVVRGIAFSVWIQGVGTGITRPGLFFGAANGSEKR
jgi:hypothetical protein